MNSLERPLIDGFVVGGFRSFHGDPQYVGPLDKVTVLAGPNNSGKSNVLRALRDVIPLSKLHGQLESLAPLDLPRPSSWTPETASSDVVVGIGLAVPDGTSAGTFLHQMLPRPEASPVGSREYTVVERIADSSALRRPGAADHMLWVLQRGNPSSGRILEPDPPQVASLLEAVDGHTSYISSLSSAQFGQSSSAEADIGRLLQHLARHRELPQVYLVPPQRAVIAADGALATDVLDLSGHGLPGFLRTLQAPTADRYHADTARLERINAFVGTVLDDPDARVLVPYNADTVHLHLHGKVLPLENLGVGISQVVLLATIATWHSKAVICIEEPENDLHPTLMRKIVRYLASSTDNQYVITTHSAHLLDAPQASVLRVASDPASGTQVAPALTPQERFETAGRLGYRASDLVQSNAIVWVEGPSDRLYLLAWLASVDKRLLEGSHFSIMFYGGRLLSHLTGAEPLQASDEAENLIHLLSLNRNMAVVIDSDRREASATINGTKRRIVREFQSQGAFAWVTKGREMENYVSEKSLADASISVHGKVPAPRSNPFAESFQGIARPDKVALAQAVVAQGVDLGILDLRKQVAALAKFLAQANDM